MTDITTDMELIQDLDFTPTLVCETVDCQVEATWHVVWTCGCDMLDCEEHKRLSMEAVIAGRGVCYRHNVPKGTNHIRTCEPL